MIYQESIYEEFKKAVVDKNIVNNTASNIVLARLGMRSQLFRPSFVHSVYLPVKLTLPGVIKQS